LTKEKYEYNEKVRELREKQLTQSELAWLIGVSTNTIRAWEYSRAVPSDDNQEKIDEIYKKVVDQGKTLTKKQQIRVRGNISLNDLEEELWE